MTSTLLCVYSAKGSIFLCSAWRRKEEEENPSITGH